MIPDNDGTTRGHASRGLSHIFNGTEYVLVGREASSGIARERKLSRGRQHTDHSTTGAVVFELHPTGRLRKQRVVLSETHVDARFETAPPLPNENGSALDEIAIETFDTKPLSLTVSTVSGASLTLLMCHDSEASPFSWSRCS